MKIFDIGMCSNVTDQTHSEDVRLPQNNDEGYSHQSLPPTWLIAITQSFRPEDVDINNVTIHLERISQLLFLEMEQYSDSSFIFDIDPVIEDKVNATMRDTAVKNLQIINKVFFELPIDIFVKAVRLLDRFITRVKVKPMYLKCVTTACLVIAAKSAEPSRVCCPSLQSVSQVSNCGGNVGDLEKMIEIIQQKLNQKVNFITSFDFLDFFYKVRPSNHLKCRQEVESALEMAQSSFKVCNYRPSVAALSCFLMQSMDVNIDFVSAMADACQINMSQVMNAAKMIDYMYKKQSGYTNRNKVIVSRTREERMTVSKPTSLDTIMEEIITSSEVCDSLTILDNCSQT